MERRALTASKNAAEPDMAVVGAGASAGAGFAWVEEEREAESIMCVSKKPYMARGGRGGGGARGWEGRATLTRTGP